jgi:signal transduction histidine kinase
MKKSHAVILLLLLTFSCELSAIPVARKGILDLRDLGNSEHFILNLNGEWEFYWNKLLHPYDFSGKNYIPDIYCNVPAYWTDYKEVARINKFGCATYRLRVLFPKEYDLPLAIDLPVFNSSYDIYLDGIYYGGNGEPGKTAEETKSEYRHNFFMIDHYSDSLDIVINVANYSHSKAGFWKPVSIGTYKELQRHLAIRLAAEWSVISLLLGFSFFFLLFYKLNPAEKLLGSFSIATVALALRPLFTSHILIQNFFEIEWIWVVRFEYLSLYFLIVGWSLFTYNLYPSRVAKILAWSVSSIFIVLSLLTLVLPVYIFTDTTIIFYPLMIVLIGYLLVESFKKTLKRSGLDMVYFTVFLFMMAGAVHDLILSVGNADSNSEYLLTYIIVVFVFIQTVLIIYKWIKAFNEKEKLQNELAFVNRNLEKLVNQRTQELQKRNEEIEKQSDMIAVKNKQLSDTIQLKNRIFSVIAHDLRSPVVNILYMLNLLKEKEYKEKYDIFANSSIQYAQMVISLLENMLVWGRDQEEKIKYSPDRRDLADIILTNLSIVKETSDKKEISVNFTQVGNSTAYFDKDLLDIIIRNLLSNAVKYTPRGGRISILLKDRTNTDDTVMLKICDNGTGMSEIKQKYLFTSTEIDSTPGTENEKGTGLGLKLCYELVKINHGTISVDSREGEGTCFMITLPVSKVHEKVT